ncbi:hypothetical protein CLOP_g11113 [Closterium sp. NIES-67]|nr:hypothetical protein CLOP_g11113 [Closterium sp. NIES-67]
MGPHSRPCTSLRHSLTALPLRLSFLLLLLLPLACAQRVAESQLPALGAILDAWGPYIPLGDTWFNKTSCAQWQGLTCNAMGQVTSLIITDSTGLAGQKIPDAIAQLSALDTLSLDHNLLAGAIPPTIGYLVSLTNLSLSGNFLEGSIPAGIFDLVNLRVLDLSTNSLSGPLPDSFGQLNLLTTLALGANQLSGPLPRSIFSLTSLQHLLVGGNSLSGTIPVAISNLRSLLALDLSRNFFYGRLPSVLGSLSSLLFLDVSNNQLSGAPIFSFLSPGMADDAQATYDLSGNYFVTPPAAYMGGDSEFCPATLKGGYGEANLTVFGASFFGSQKGNCFLGGYWNKSESFTDSDSKSNWRGSKRGGGGRWANRVSGDGYWNSGGNSSSDATGAAGATGGGAGNGAASNGGVCPIGPQRRPIECVSFCGAALPTGPCNGLGTCMLTGASNVPACMCNPGMYNATLTIRFGKDQQVSYPSCLPYPAPAAPPPLGSWDNSSLRKRKFRGAQLDQTALVSGSYFNSYFRYASLGFTGNATSPKWQITPTVDWRARVPSALQPAKDQGLCSACWIFAPVAAVEAVYAIVFGAAAPSLAEQRAIDCQGTWTCAGGRPDDAFNYIAASGGLPSSDSYPYTGIPSSDTCKVLRRSLISSEDKSSSSSSATDTASSLLAGGRRLRANSWGSSLFWGKGWSGSVSGGSYEMPGEPYPIAMFEQVQIRGWLGIAIAVQAQPVVVYLEAREDSFIKFTGGFVYNDPACFTTQVVDHLVVVVGFNLLDATPHWIIRNSWGPSWGENGYMKIAIAGGPGICGMNTLPGLYPVLSTPDPCGPINPCGSGTCTPVKSRQNGGARNKCTCPSGFTAVTNLDKTQTCAVANVCSFSALNPCGHGTCVDDGKGGYSCLCSPGYVLGQRTDTSPTCIPGSVTVKVTLQVDMTCNQVRSTFLVSDKEFSSLNPAIECPSTIPAGTVLVVKNASTTAEGCVVPYTIIEGDTCTLVASTFGLSLAELATVNPGLNCDALTTGQQVCIKLGAPLPQTCLNYYTVNPGETCNDVMINSYPPISATQLYQYNPGLICTADGSQRLVGQELCIDSAPIVGASCTYGTYTVVKGDTCGGIICKICKCSSANFNKYNYPYVCTSGSLYVGRVLCKCPP